MKTSNNKFAFIFIEKMGWDINYAGVDSEAKFES